MMFRQEARELGPKGVAAELNVDKVESGIRILVQTRGDRCPIILTTKQARKLGEWLRKAAKDKGVE